MKQFNLKITPQAEQDIENIGDYIAIKLKNPSTALNIVKGIRQTIKTLQLMPLRHELIDDPVLAKHGIRTIYYKNYRIFYLVTETDVQIIRVLHILTNSPDWLY